MKIIASLCLGLFLLTFAGAGDSFAQNRKITVVLVRHAEKDASDTGSDPNLSAEGKLRAERFAKLIKKYKPRRIYSTDYRRTRQTVEPIAGLRKIQIQTYDPRRQSELAAEILTFRKNRRVIVVGHSNTIPGLANLLVKEDKYKNLADSEYGQIWLIRIKKGKVRTRIIEY